LLHLRRWAPESAISGAPEPERTVKLPFGRAPAGAAPGVGAGALPKRPLVGCTTSVQEFYVSRLPIRRHATTLVTVESGSVSVEQLLEEFNQKFDWGGNGPLGSMDNTHFWCVWQDSCCGSSGCGCAGGADSVGELNPF
jgi:hypothetical protein